MPMPKKLSCEEAYYAIKAFLEGASVRYIANHFGVTRPTITRLLKRETYKKCTAIDNALPSNYLANLEDRMRENAHRGRGQKVEVEIG